MTSPNHVSLLTQRLTQIAQSVEVAANTLALIGLGSAGQESQRMDRYSDLDFFLIVEVGYKQHFITNIDWLTNVAPVAYYFQNTADGYKLLFDDNVFCEFAIFEPDELKKADYAPGKIIWSAPDCPKSFATPSKPLPAPVSDVTFILGELLTNLYVGLGRYLRGEHLSASYFIQHYAINRLIQLIRATEKPNGNSLVDPWSAERRFEEHYPQHAKLLHDCIQGSVPNCVKKILEHLKTYYISNTSTYSVIVDKIEDYLAEIQSI